MSRISGTRPPCRDGGCGKLAASGTYSAPLTWIGMTKEPITVPHPNPAEPQKPPVQDPQPYKDPVEPPPGDPREDRPLRDPVTPNTDKPRL